MADKRKLQNEIDRTLKKVQEGRVAFQEIMDKYEASNNQAQKEKFEADLKKEIKKLQRLRDQIKTWFTLNEIKDKRLLVDARKTIEVDMERFKVIEKETKTKAYSKEGLLINDNRKDPAQREKEEMAEWLRQSITQFKSIAEKIEFSIESLLSTLKKKRLDKDKGSQLEEKKSRLEICQFHIERLETTLRHFDNERIEVDILKNVRTGVEYLLETLDSDDPQFIDDKSLYDDLSLEDLGNIPIASGITLGSGSSDTEAPSAIVKVAEPEPEPVENKLDFSSTSTPLKIEKAKVIKPVKDLANQTAPPGMIGLFTSSAKKEMKMRNELKKSQSNTPPAEDSSQHPTPQPSEAESVTSRESSKPWLTECGPQLGLAPLVTLMNAKALSASDSQPNVLIHPKDAAAPFRNKSLDKSRSMHYPIELQSQLSALESAYNRLPNPCDTERARMTICKNLCVGNTPSCYPKEPLPIVNQDDYYLKLETQTLFFIFYYFEGTRAQYLAAKALKKLSWRFHTKLMMWFQRHEEPKQITEEYEAGTYIFYDYKSMSQRKKEDFVFHYNFLEDKDF
ncbi:CCR4-NOT transcription complex, subunit 3 [Cichlidogyrus casuarinus]|uniref:CCR4-NOT transcription complex, subunit 3 n=1 Tax=Cichlidogyrus casuarinus TaxID=1844966 RepID=A0ABD2QD05_9PLAT